MELGAAGHRRVAGEAGHVPQLIHHRGVRHEGGDAQLVADLPGDEGPQVGGVLALGPGHAVAQQGVGGAVGAAADGGQHAAPAADGAEGMGVEALFRQGVQHQAAAPFLLLRDGGKGADLRGGVAQGFVKEQGLVGKHADFGGRGAGIDHKDVMGHGELLLMRVGCAIYQS